MTTPSRPEHTSIQNDASDSLPPSLAGRAPIACPVKGGEFPQVIPALETHKGRNLILCFDGTGDQYDHDNSNIVRFFQLLKKDDRSKQMVDYQAGLGTGVNSRGSANSLFNRISKAVDGAIATGLRTHVRGGYEFLMQNYTEGDRISMFGFSRGAYTARALAGMLHKVGLLPAHNYEQVKFAYHMFKRDDEEGWKMSNGFKRAFSIDVKIDFLGVFDTVNSVGIIPRELPVAKSNYLVRVFRHAVALDERRAKFKANLWGWSTEQEEKLCEGGKHKKYHKPERQGSLGTVWELISGGDNKEDRGRTKERAGSNSPVHRNSRITHATPASFASHIYDRDQEDKIAEQLIGNQPLGPVADLMLGGGLAFFWPNSTKGSSRKDSRDLIAEAKRAGYNAFATRAGFDALGGGKTAKLPYLGVFTPGHMSYEVDRDPKLEPSLLEMTKTALETLKRATKDSSKGYFIIHILQRIDHAGHSNDLIGHLHEIIMYNTVVDYLKSWVDSNDDTVLIGTADHECAGLTLGGIVTTGEYQYNPAPLAGGKHSSSYLASQWASYNGSDPDGYLNSLFEQYGINDANSTEIQVAKDHKSSSSFNDIHFGQSLTRRAMVKWATLGHTAVDVNLIGYGPNSELLRGNHDNTEVGLFINDQLGLDLPSVTKLLNDKKNEDWLVNKVGRDKVEHGVKSGARRRALGHQHN
ncbi:alkaline phosphatase [Ceratobasidium sp. AG-Ba]|nr:alkaline phosphatase [Ceratobasidium sp. AG-Ba]